MKLACSFKNTCLRCYELDLAGVWYHKCRAWYQNRRTELKIKRLFSKLSFNDSQPNARLFLKPLTVRFKNFRDENFRYFWNSRFIPRCENFRGFRYSQTFLYFMFHFLINFCRNLYSETTFEAGFIKVGHFSLRKNP